MLKVGDNLSLSEAFLLALGRARMHCVNYHHTMYVWRNGKQIHVGYKRPGQPCWAVVTFKKPRNVTVHYG